MFTGIIQDQGKLINKEKIGGDNRFTFAVNKLGLDDVMLGDSIAVNGVCLTVISKQDKHFSVDASIETLDLTTLGLLNDNDAVNLELAMTPKTAFGGHIVSGHVDAVAEIVSLSEDARSWRFGIKIPTEFSHYVANKGSITIDGVSLTVNDISDDDIVSINIIPHTMQETRFSEYKQGSKVNIEIDLIARYLERLIQGKK